MENKSYIASQSFCARVSRHMQNFGFVWVLLLALLIDSLFGFDHFIVRLIAYAIMVVIVIFLCWKPMNVIYGLIGTRGKTEHFILLLILSVALFSFTYYFGFFKNAGITYDVNQPHVEFSMFKGEPRSVIDRKVVNIRHRQRPQRSNNGNTPITSRDSIGIPLVDSIPNVQLFTDNLERYHYYQRIDFSTVLRNTFLTTLMQEPSDFCVNVGTYVRFGERYSIYKEDTNRFVTNIAQARLFHWILILQIFLS